MNYPTNEPVHYMHFKLGKGRATAAIQTVTEGHPVAYVAVAFCSPKDQFCRRTGRLIAAGRLKKHKFFWELTVNPKYPVKEQVELALDGAAGNKNDARFPSWARGVEVL